jgi:NitT/TauT family transport system substrate-binding protein
MMKKGPAFGLLLAFVICFSTACSGKIAVPSPKPLRVEWTLWQGDYTLLVANQMGFFKKHGVDVVPAYYDSSTQAAPDLAGAKLDGGIFTMSDILLASGLTDIRAIMVSENVGRYAVIGSPDIQSINDLRGKRIGFNIHTSSEMFVSYMLKSRRMTMNDITYVEMSPSQVSQNIPDQIDAGLVWEPYITRAIHEGKHVVYESDYYSSLIPRLVVFRKATIEQRPNDIRAFVLAWDEGVNYLISHPQESLAIISKATGLPASDISLTSNENLLTTSSNEKLFADNPGSDPNSIYFIAGFNRDFFNTMGYLNPPDINALLDPSFLK